MAASLAEGGIRLRLVYWTFGLLALFVLVAGSAAATHYRYGTLSWEPTEIENEVLFTGGQAWRTSYGWYQGGMPVDPQPGMIIDGEGCIQTGSGPCLAIHLKVNARSDASDWFSATFVDAAGNEGIRHLYPAANNNGQPWQVQWGSCCRLSLHSSGNFHVNNPDQDEKLRTFVDLSIPNAAPRSSLPPINACPRDALCAIPIPAADREGDGLAFRLSTASEAGDLDYVPPGAPYAPNAATIDPVSGILSWDTHGATVSTSATEHTLYSVQVMVEDGATQTPLDFFIELLPVGTTPPYWVTPPTPCGETLSVTVGGSFAFDVRAQSDDAARIVRVSHLGLPLGASFPPVTPANPASGAFTWTPTQAQAGDHLVVFAAEDDLGYPAPACPVVLRVIAHPPPQCVAPPLVDAIRGIPASFGLSATSPHASRTVTLSLESGPLGLSLATGAPGNPTTGTATWSAPYVGAPAARFVAVDSEGIRARCLVRFDVEVPTGQAFTMAVWTGSAVPAALEYGSPGADVRRADEGNDMRYGRIAVVDQPQLLLYAHGVEEWADVTIGAGIVRSVAGSEIAHLQLAGGLVQLQGLRQEVAVTWDPLTRAVEVQREATVARVLVNGLEQAVTPGETLTVPIPGGELELFARSTTTSGDAVSAIDELAHVYLTGPYGREEVILGSVIVQAGVGFDFATQTRDIHAHDDLRSGRDAGSDRSSALALPMGAHDASMPVGDRSDAYTLRAAHGEKIVVVAQPAAGVYATGGALVAGGTPPPFVAAPGLAPAPTSAFRADLYDPTGELRESSLYLQDAAPARVELNADLSGEWLVVVHREPAIALVNYSVALSVTPVPLLPQNDAFSLADAAPLCAPGDAGIPVVSSGLWPGVLRDDDFADVYRFDARIGDAVAVALKPGEDADGAAMGLRLYDRDCALLVTMDQLTGLAKGELRFALRTPSLYTGAYYVQVVRLNGVANHYVEIAVVDPMPTTPTNDATTGQDAPASREQAIAAPPVAFQGRIEEEDAGDAYALALREGAGKAYIALSFNALSSANVALYDPMGNLVPPSTAIGSTLVRWDFLPWMSGDHTLVIGKGLAGGGYSVVWAQLPMDVPV